MIRTYKYRIYPTESQKQRIEQHFGACRFVYNLALETKMYAYSSHKKVISGFDLINQIPDLKKECGWLNDVTAQSLQQSIVDLNNAFTKFFKGCCDFPKFKKKKAGGAFRSPNGKQITIFNNRIILPKFREGVRFVEDIKFQGKIKNATISKTKTDKYFISILSESENIAVNKPSINDDNSIGIDLGLKSFLITSNGNVVDNPKYLYKIYPKIKYLNRQLSKKQRGGNNRKKARIKLAIQYEKTTNQRKDFLHKLSTNLIKNHDTICIEDLNIKGMKMSGMFGWMLSDTNWFEFIRQLKYKAEWYGKNVLQIPRFEPSTKICSNCDTLNHALTLKDRGWLCANCGTFHDRDINAAINIKNYCLKNYGGGLHRQKPVELPVIIRSDEAGSIYNSVNYYNTEHVLAGK